MKYRILKKMRLVGSTKYYPQYKYSWFPFWFSIKESYTCDEFPVEVNSLEEAQCWVSRHKMAYAKAEVYIIKCE